MSAGLLNVARFAALVGRDPADDAVWAAVELAEDLVTGEAGALLADPPQPGLAAIAHSVAARLLAGPVGVTAEAEGGTSFNYAAGNGAPMLTAEERAAVRRALGRGTPGVGMLGLTSPNAGHRSFDNAYGGGRDPFINSHPASRRW